MKVNREQFLAQLDKVKPALARGGAIPETAHIWFDGKQAFAYDGGLGIRIPLEGDIKGGLPGTQLIALLKSTTAEEVELAPGKKAGLAVKIGGGSVTLVLLSSTRSPWGFKDAKATTSLEVSEALLEGLRRTLLIKVAKPSLVEHYGIILFDETDETGHTLGLYSTDGDMIIRVLVGGYEDLKALHKLVLPRAFVEQVVAQVAPGATLELLSNSLRVRGEGVEIHSNLLDTTGVQDIPAVIEKYKDGGVRTALPVGFSAALGRAAILAGTDTPYVVLGTVSGQLEVRGKFKYGRLDESLDLAVEVPEAEIKLAADKLPGLAEATDFTLTNAVMTMFGGDDFLFMVGAHDSG